MDYRMLTSIPEMDVAREAMKYIQVNGIDAYIEDKTNYEEQPIVSQWAVMVDAKDVGKAEKLLSQFNELKAQESTAEEEAVVEQVEQQAVEENEELGEQFVLEEGEQEEQFVMEGEGLEEQFVMEDGEDVPPLPYEEPYNYSNQPDYNYNNSDESSSAGCSLSIISIIIFIILCVNFYNKCQRSYKSPPRIEHFEKDYLNRYNHNHNSLSISMMK